MCTVLLPPDVNPTAVNKYIKQYQSIQLSLRWLSPALLFPSLDPTAVLCMLFFDTLNLCFSSPAIDRLFTHKASRYSHRFVYVHLKVLDRKREENIPPI